MDLEQKLEELSKRSHDRIQEITDLKELNDIRVSLLGKKVPLLKFCAE